MPRIRSWVHPYTGYTGEGGPQILENWGQSMWKYCHDVIIEAVKDCSVHPTFSFYVYKVFGHLKMLWIRSWVQPYNVTPVKVGP
jgi:hypothetical protein